MQNKNQEVSFKTGALVIKELVCGFQAERMSYDLWFAPDSCYIVENLFLIK